MCPVGCGEVMYVQGKTNHKVFCYCTGCAVAFPHPKNAQVGAEFEIKPIEDFSPDSIILPTKDAIIQAGFNNWIFDTTNEKEWYSEQDINNEYLHKNT